MREHVHETATVDGLTGVEGGCIIGALEICSGDDNDDDVSFSISFYVTNICLIHDLLFLPISTIESGVS